MEHILFQKYRRLRLLGQGSYGETYLVQHVQLEVLRAIKCVRKASQIAIPQEAHILKALKHPGIPVIFDLEQDEEYCYIVMEYIEGQPLSQYLSSHSNVSVSQLLLYGIQLCDIVDYLHTRKPEPIIHLDLQPKNIILHNGQLKLIDFGNALGISRVQDTAYCCGTHGFASPEQYQGKHIGPGSDLYSIGKVLYYMLTGEVLYDIGNVSGICFKRLCRLLQSEELGEQLAEIICKCLYPTPALRYPDVKALMLSLEYIADRIDKSSIWKTVIPKSQKSITVALCGASSGIGVTHMGLALTGACNRKTQTAIYVEEWQERIDQSGGRGKSYRENDSDRAGRMRRIDKTVYCLQEADRCVQESFGICRKGNCYMLSDTGTVQYAKTEPFRIKIWDLGVCNTGNVRKMSQTADICLLIAGMQPWERKDYRNALAMLPPNTISLLNFGNSQIFRQLQQEMGYQVQKRMFRIPYISDPFVVDGAGEAFLQMLLGIIEAELKNNGKKELLDRIVL